MDLELFKTSKMYPVLVMERRLQPDEWRQIGEMDRQGWEVSCIPHRVGNPVHVG